MKRFVMATASTIAATDGFAASMSQLEGAWAMSEAKHSRIFEKRGQNTCFRHWTGSASTGIMLSVINARSGGADVQATVR